MMNAPCRRQNLWFRAPPAALEKRHRDLPGPNVFYAVFEAFFPAGRQGNAENPRPRPLLLELAENFPFPATDLTATAVKKDVLSLEFTARRPNPGTLARKNAGGGERASTRSPVIDDAG